MVKTFLISPPFGRWLSNKHCTRVKGSFTLHRRPGLLRQIIKTVRPLKGGWVNNIGLRNPGIDSIGLYPDERHLYSVAAIEPGDWETMKHFLPMYAMVEMNFGCPNWMAHKPERGRLDSKAVRSYADRFPVVSVKLAPMVGSLTTAIVALDSGATHIHMANSFPVEDGGYSGPSNKPMVMFLVDELANDIARNGYRAKIIAGGGIRTVEDIEDYQSAGADHFSLSTAWLRPLTTRRVIDEAARSICSNR